MGSVTEELERYLYVGPRMSLTRIVMEYNAIMDYFWAEQQLTKEEICKAEMLLGRLTCDLGSDNWLVQPWFVGPGSEMIGWLVKKFWPSDKIMTRPFEFFPDFPATCHTSVNGEVQCAIYLFGGHGSKFDVNLWSSSILEDLISFDVPYRESMIKKYPRGIGIFNSSEQLPVIRPLLQRKCVQFHLPKKISMEKLDDYFSAYEISSYWKDVQSKYLLAVKSIPC